MENQIEITFDTSQAEKTIENSLKALYGLKTVIGEIEQVAYKVFGGMSSFMARTTQSIYELNGALLGSTNTLKELMNQLKEGQDEDRVWNIVGNVSTNLSTLVTALASAEDLKKAFTNLTSVLSNTRDALKNVGSAILGVIGNMGTMVGSLTTSAGKWIAENAAIVASTAAQWAQTAAQWAQTAAATAWQGICAAATAVTTAFGAAMTFLTSPIGLVVIGITALIAIIALLIANWDTVSAKTQEVWGFIQGLFAQFDDFLQNIFAKDFTEQFGELGSFMNAFCKNIENVWNAVKSIFGGIIDFVKNVFAGNWGAALEGLISIFKGVFDMIGAVIKAPFNLIIGFVNSIIQSAVDRINIIINMLNGLSFDIPDWVPVFGGKKFGFNLEPIKAPQFPLLAKGAVLPANRPFLAMVGDQRHGTNIEAPLATIQEAVALVMQDQTAAILSGVQASVGIQREILEAVLGIQIGDDVIGRATARYNRKMAIAKGGI